MSFINDDFMLHSDAAKHLYNDFAKKMPIIDYHCHLSPAQIAENHRFENIGELVTTTSGGLCARTVLTKNI